MRKRGYKYYIRKTHRYLGVVLGVQFLFWTVGGLYFSWTKIEQIRGEHLRSEPQPIAVVKAARPPADALGQYIAPDDTADLSRLRVVDVLGAPHYYLNYSRDENENVHLLVSALDGTRRGPVDESEAKEIAARALNGSFELASVELISKDNVGGHHEYRGRPLPAWVVSFKNADGLTVYVGANDGQVNAVRTDRWRVFDFLWMLHTLDLEGRDDINNYLLRAFSIFGLLSLLSGFLLYVVTSKTLKRAFNRRKTA